MVNEYSLLWCLSGILYSMPSHVMRHQGITDRRENLACVCVRACVCKTIQTTLYFPARYIYNV